MEFGEVTVDPTAGIALVRTNGRTGSRTLSGDEIDQLLTAATTGSRAGLVRRDQAILQLLLFAGLRVSEVVNLSKDDLAFDYPGIHLRVCGPTRKSKARRIPLPDTVCRVLNSYLQIRPTAANTDFFFLNQEGQPISKRTVQRVIADCAKTAGLSGISAQSIRRTFAKQLLDDTQNLTLVSERLGHQNRNITEQYLSVGRND